MRPAVVATVACSPENSSSSTSPAVVVTATSSVRPRSEIRPAVVSTATRLRRSRGTSTVNATRHDPTWNPSQSPTSPSRSPSRRMATSASLNRPLVARASTVMSARSVATTVTSPAEVPTTSERTPAASKVSDVVAVSRVARSRPATSSSRPRTTAVTASTRRPVERAGRVGAGAAWGRWGSGSGRAWRCSWRVRSVVGTSASTVPRPDPDVRRGGPRPAPEVGRGTAMYRTGSRG